MLIVALAVLLLAVAGLLFVVVGLALIAGSLAVPALIVAGGIAGGTGVMLIVIAILVVALFPPLRLFFDGLLALLRISPDLGQVMRSLAAALLSASGQLEALSRFLNDSVKPIATTTKQVLDDLSSDIPAGGVTVITALDQPPHQILDVHQGLQDAANALTNIANEIDAQRNDAHNASVALSDVSLVITGVFGTAP